MKDLKTEQAVFSHFTLKRDLDLDPSQMVLVHFTEHYGMNIKF